MKLIPPFLRPQASIEPVAQATEPRTRLPEISPDAAVIREGLRRRFGKAIVHDVTARKGADGLPVYHVTVQANFSRSQLLSSGIVTGTAELERDFHTIKIPVGRFVAAAQEDAAFAHHVGLAKIPSFSIDRIYAAARSDYLIQIPKTLPLTAFEQLGVPEKQIALIGIMEDALQIIIPFSLVQANGMTDFHSAQAGMLAVHAERQARDSAERNSFWDALSPSREDPSAPAPVASAPRR